jgi:hypothetical protein
MGLAYVDLFLAHWPYASKPISREAVETSKGDAKRSPEEKGLLIENQNR